MKQQSLSWGAVVVTYNSAAHVRQCLESITPLRRTSVVVVDNNSSDTTRAVLQRYPITLLPQADNRGFAAACNIGAQKLESECVLFLNPDAVLAPRALENATAYLTTHPRVGVVGLKLIDAAGEQQRDNFGDTVTLWNIFIRKLTPPPAAADTALTCAWVSGGAMLVRRAAWRQVGGFDTGYFMYWEDVDLCKRMREAGWQVVWLPSAVATHYRGQSLSNRQRKTAHYDASADRYFRTHYAGWIWFLHHCFRRLFRLVSPQVL